MLGKKTKVLAFMADIGRKIIKADTSCLETILLVFDFAIQISHFFSLQKSLEFYAKF